MESKEHTADCFDYQDVGDRIRKYRVKRRYTQEYVAELTDLSVNYIGLIERGQRLPSTLTLISLSKVLQVSIDTLIFGEEEETLSNQVKILNLTLQDKQPERVKIFMRTVISLADLLDEN